MDAGNLLKPALARGELPCIGATTDDLQGCLDHRGGPRCPDLLAAVGAG